MNFAFLELLNSDWHDYRGSGRTEDRLEDPKWLARFLARWRLEIREKPDHAAREALRALRARLRRMAEDLDAGRQLSDEDLAGLNAVLEKAPSVRRLAWDGEGRYAIELAPLEKDWNWVLAELAASFVDLVTQHDPRRVKVCENPDCRWVFYDESRSRSRRWCDASGCGNLLKVRRFRERHHV